MADENFVIQVILRAKDEMARAWSSATRNMKGFRGEVDKTQADMRNLDRSTANTTRGVERLGSRLDQVRGKFNAIRGPTRQADSSMRGMGNTVERLNNRLLGLNSTVHKNRESIAKFDNEIRGLRLLIVFAQFQALTSAVIGLGGALTAVAGSAVTAGAAIGGALTAGVAQAVPAIGLLAASIGRLKAVFDVVSQAQKTQQAEATQATSATNKQADQVDKLTSAQNSLRDAHERVRESQRRVNEARREARRDLEDLRLAEQASQLQFEQAEDRVRQLRSSGTTGFELRSAQIDLQEARTDRRRTGQELQQASTRLAPGIRDAKESLRDAQQGLAEARRGLAGARRDVGEGGAATVAAGRQLQYLEAQLTQSERRLVASITRLQETWRQVSRPITDIIVDSFTRATNRAEKVIQSPKLIGAFRQLATAGAKEMDRITATFTNARGVAFFERSTRRLAANLEPAGIAAERLMHAFMNIADAAGPTLHDMVEDIAKLAGGIENATENTRGLSNLFAYGRVQLIAWFNLARSIGEVIKALVAPGGDLQSGAAASGLRIINDLTTRIRSAAEWLNDNPLKVREFFGDSEEVFQRLLDLTILLARHLFNLFDPGTVDAFADIIEALLPPFEQAVIVLGELTKGFAALMQVPGLRQAMQLGFGLVVFARIAGRLQALFLGFIGPLSTMAVVGSRIGSTFSALLATTGGLTARITAAAAAWKAYGTAATGAAAATTGVAAAAGAGAARGRPLPARDPATGRFISAEAAAAAGGAGGLASRGAGLLRGAGRVARFAGAGALIAGGIGAITTSGNIGERLQAGASLATFGAFPGLRSTDERLKTILERMKDVKGELKLKDVTPEWEDFNDEQQRTIRQAVRLHNAAEEIKRVFRNFFPAADITNKPLFAQALGQIKELREKGAENITALRDHMRITFTLIGESTEKGSTAWRMSMIENTQAGVSGVVDLLNSGKIKTKTALEEITRITRRQMRLTRDHMKDMSGEARDYISENFRTARVRAERQLGNLEDATGRSLKILRRLFRTELGSYGFSDNEINTILKAKRQGDDYKGPRGSKAFEGTSDGAAVGGYIGTPGERGRDQGMYRLGRGEAVLNWAHQRIVEPAMNAYYGHGLPDMFKRTRAWHAGSSGIGGERGLGLARGGIVPVPGFPGELANRSILDEIAFFTKKYGLTLTDAYGQGHQSPGHTTFGTAADLAGADRSMDAAVKALVRRGYKVLYDGRFGSTAWPGHGPSTVAGSNAHIHVEFGSRDGNMPSVETTARNFKIPRVEIRGSGGQQNALTAIGQAAVDAVREGAIKRGRRAVKRTMGTEGGEPGAGTPAPPGRLRSWLRQALEITKLFSPGNLNALYGRAMQESGGNPKAINLWDSNAAAGIPSKGLLQTIDPTFDAYKLKGMGNIWNPIHNAVAAIRYMMARYGHIVGPSSSGYAMGGMIPGPDGAPRSILAHAGEWVLNKGQQVKAAGMAGLTAGQLRDRLGFSGGPTGYQGGGLVVGDSIAAGMERFLKKMGFRVDAQKNRTADETLDVLKRLISDRTKRVVFDAGTNDTDPQVLRKVLSRLMNVVGDRELLLTTAGGTNAAAKNRIIRQFAERENVNLFDSQRFARSKGFDIDRAGHYPGSSAYRARARAVARALGGAGGGGGEDTAFDAPDILPITLGGLGKLVNDFFKHLRQFRKKGLDNFKSVNRNMDAITADGGLLDQMSTAIERQVSIMTTRAGRRGLRVRGGRVEDTRGELGDIRAERQALLFTTRGLRREDRVIGRGLGAVRRSLRQIRRGGIDDDEREVFNDLIGQRRNLQGRRAATRQSILENLQARFELQARAIEAAMNKSLRPILAAGRANELAQRIAAAFGRGGEVNFIDLQIQNLREQKPIIELALQRAKAQGNTELADQLSEQLQDIEGTIAELIAERLQQQIADVDKRFGAANTRLGLRERLAAALGILSLNTPITGGNLGGLFSKDKIFTRASAFEERGRLIQDEIAQRKMLLRLAVADNNVKAIEELTERIKELQVELVENTRALFLARVEEVNRRFSTLSGQSTARGRIAELQAELGLITGTESQVRQRAELELVGSGLRTQAIGLQQLLAEARARQDEEQIANLEQAILDNTVAQLENTLSVKNLDGSLNNTQSFSSTAWQWFRTAIFTGSGGLLPQFNFGPTVGLGGGMPSPTIGGGYAPGGEAPVPVVNLEINEAGQIPDPVYFGNRIAWAVKTPGT